MKKTIIFILSMMLGMSVMAQKSIQLRSVDKAECVKSDMTSLQASFSFSSIEAQDYPSERGTFSWLSLANTIIGGNEGDPQIPVVNELIAVPFGAQPTIRVTNYSTTDYRLEDYDIHTLVPRQPSLRKDKRPEDVPFVYNEAAYQSTRGFRSEPMAVVEVVGTMRGVQLGKMTIEPVSYDPVNNTLRVFNDIEVEVSFDGADAAATEKMLVDTYSPYFDIVYKQLFNGRGVRDIYDQHPDLYTTPVKMLVVTTSTYANSTPFQNWLTWKKQKGINVDIYTVTSSTSSSTIRSGIQSRYNTNHPSFLVIVGDETVVPYYSLWDYDSYYGDAATDLEYASVDGDIYHDMFLSRMPVASTTQLGYLVDKILMYEKYTMPDPSYLDETLLIAGWDQPNYSWQTSWTNIAGKPTIQYANNNYFNATHGITPHVFITTASGQRTCYNYINNVGFINYTAHGDIQEWSDPSFTNSNVNSLTNANKPFWAMGNCCLSASFSNTSTYPCFGEAMVRAQNKGAFGYIGSVVETYWYEDFYFGVGAFNASYSTNNNPTISGTSVGAYDAMFDDTGFNTLNSVPYIGNISVSYAYAQNYTNSEITPEYYWRCYQCFGDGSVMPYLKQPAANNVSHNSVLPIGANSFTINAHAGSYVSITVNNEIIGVAQVGTTGTVSVPITPQNTAGTAMIVVTRNQRQPYINTIPLANSTQYTITCNPSEHGTISAPEQAYASSIVTLTATPDPGYCLSSWTVTDANNQPISVTGNQFIMPESNVTVSATFVEGLTITLASVTHGSISADPMYALQGTTINLTATPASGYEFGSWLVYKTGDTNTTVSVNNNSFTMPNYPVTVSATFVLGPTELTVYDGTATNQYIPMYGYYFDDFTKSECIIPASQLTAMNGCTITAITFYPSSVSTRSWDDSEQTVFLKEVSGTTLGGSYSGTSGATIVKQALLEMPTAGTAYTITFDTPYFYNGGNLLIGIYNTTDGDYNQVYWYGTSNLTSGVSAYGSNGNGLSSVDYNAQAFLPKTTFTYMPVPDEPVAITVSANPANGGTVTGAGTYDPGITATLTATANEGYTFANWTRNGVVMSTSATYSFTVSNAAEYVANFTINSYNITAAAVPAEGGTVTVGARNREDLVYDFENGWQNWTAFKGTTGTSSHNWMHNTEYVAYDSNGNQIVPECHNSSSGMMLSESYISASTSGGSGTAVTPDNYLVSPQFRLGGSFTFYVASRMSNYPAEKFSVLVSESGNNSASAFTHTELTVTLSDNSWHEYTIDLSDYSGMGYVAIRHYDCYDQHLLYIDDVTIVEGQDPSTGSGNFNYGETCVVTASPNTDYYFVNWTENNATVSSEASYSFTVTGDRNLVANFSQTPVFTKIIPAYTDLGGYYLIASPIGEVSPTNVTNMLENTYDLYCFDQSSDGSEWINYKSDNGNFNLVSGKGYLYANSQNDTLTFTGYPYNGNGQVTLSKTSGTHFEGWNLVGNPFAQTAYITKPFYTMNLEGSEVIASTSNSVGAMEGIFVVANEDGETMTFSTEEPGRGAALVMNICQNRGSVIDRAIICFGEGNNLPKFMLNKNNTTLYILQDNKDYAVVNANNVGEMPVNFKAAENGTYTLSFSMENVAFNYLHLIDTMTGADIDLLALRQAQGPASYTFEAKTTDQASRFRLVFSANETE